MPEFLEVLHKELLKLIPSQRVIGMCKELTDPPGSYEAKASLIEGIHLTHRGALYLKKHLRNHTRKQLIEINRLERDLLD